MMSLVAVGIPITDDGICTLTVTHRLIANS